jgi:membrane protease YdiL (CAAX protease family)
MQPSAKSFPWSFLLASFLFSWAVWIPVGLTGMDYQSSPCLLIAVLVGAFGPGLTAIILTYRNRVNDDFNDFRQRIYQIRRIRPAWLLIILGLWPSMHLLAIGISHLADAPIPNSPFLQELLLQPNTIPLIVFMYLLQSGLEELGWRGYLQEKLGQIYSPASGSLLVGVIHTLWHLPLFWVVGTNQIQMGFGADFYIFILFVISSSVLSAWCYYGNGHSIFAVALLQTTGNLSFDIFAYAPGTLKHLVYVLIMAVGAAAAFFYMRRYRFDRPLQNRPDPA